jgi:hypothetical protein
VTRSNRETPEGTFAVYGRARSGGGRVNPVGGSDSGTSAWSGDDGSHGATGPRSDPAGDGVAISGLIWSL